MKPINALRKSNVVCLYFVIPFLALAQKLPKVQNVSLRTPDNIKIDGLATEWNDHFQAFNTATRVNYTLANDDSIIYLIIKATDLYAVNKIINTGITFTVNKNKSFTFPIFSDQDDKNALSEFRYYRKKNPDSVMSVANKYLNKAAKTIGITGIKTITDPEISVYNSDGIKVMAAFDKDFNYTYEIAIPLKLLELSSAKFTYNITLNAPPQKRAANEVTFSNPDDNYLYTQSAQNLHSDYTLAK